MKTRAVLFTERINVAGVHLLPSQGVDQDRLTEGHGHHYHEREHSKERHGQFDDSGEGGEVGEDGVDGVAEVASKYKLIKAKAL